MASGHEGMGDTGADEGYCRLGALVAKGAPEAGRHEGRNAMGKGDGEGSKWKAVGKGNGERERHGRGKRGGGVWM